MCCARYGRGHPAPCWSARVDRECGGRDAVTVDAAALTTLVAAADGDARRGLNLLEVALDLAQRRRVAR